MKYVKHTSKTFISFSSVAILFLLVYVCISSDNNLKTTSFETAGTDINIVFNTTLSSRRQNNTTSQSTTSTEYECVEGVLPEGNKYDYFNEQIEQARRKALLDEVCTKEKAKTAIPERRHFLLNRQHQILYCWIHKVASTSWTAFMLNLRGRHVKPKKIYKEIVHLAAESIEELQSAARDYRFRLIAVRHPFSRLISAYRDRIWAAKRKFSAQALTHVPRILHLTRPSVSQSTASIIRNRDRTLRIIPTFEEFVRYLLTIAKIHEPERVQQQKSNATNLSSVPRPNISAFDVHWMPYYHHCSICNIPYNFIIKLETIENDKKYLMEEMRKDLNEKLKVNQISNFVSDGENKTSTKVNLKKSLIVENGGKRGNDISLEEEHNNNKTLKCLNNQDEKCLQSKLGLSTIDFDLQHLEVSNIGPSCSCYYFSQISKSQLDSLKQIYDIDFKMFDYNTDEYEKCLNLTDYRKIK